ncbi:unnamed protein product [Lathyrus sativus]|nr:unnamed protein product [Lathyrus sativus]
MSVEEASELARRAIYHATFRDGASGGVASGEVIYEKYSLEYGTDCLEMHVGAVETGERAIVIDDLVATGGTHYLLCCVLLSCSSMFLVNHLASLDPVCMPILSSKENEEDKFLALFVSVMLSFIRVFNVMTFSSHKMLMDWRSLQQKSYASTITKILELSVALGGSITYMALSEHGKVEGRRLLLLFVGRHLLPQISLRCGEMDCRHGPSPLSTSVLKAC